MKSLFLISLIPLWNPLGLFIQVKNFMMHSKSANIYSMFLFFGMIILFIFGYIYLCPFPRILCDKSALPLCVYQAATCLSSATPRACVITPPGRLTQTFVWITKCAVKDWPCGSLEVNLELLSSLRWKAWRDGMSTSVALMGQISLKLG